MSQPDDMNVIVLTSDAELLTKLRNKLDEYAKRYAFQAPEVSPRATYKYALLSRLLEYGTLDVAAAEKEFSGKDWYHAGYFNAVVKIIRAYNSGDTSGVVGGTGLK